MLIRHNCIFLKAVLDSGDEIDVYDNKKFIAITGNIRSNTNELARCPSAMASWLRDKLGAKVTEQDKSKLTNIKINQNNSQLPKLFMPI